MWVIQLCSKTEERVFYLVADKKQVTIGRSNSDICIDKDSSISRKHCVLHIAEKSQCPFPVKTKTGIWVVDAGSKYGTFVQNSDASFEQVPANQATLLHHGGMIRFGILESVWSITYKPLYMSTSLISQQDKLNLRTQLQPIGGILLGDCDKICSYLVTGSITLTAKVLLALVYGIPIVRPDFVGQLINCVRENKKILDDKAFRPEVSEPTVRVKDVNLDPSSKRCSLFSGKKFYHSSAAVINRFKVIVEAAGGFIGQLESKEQLLEDGAILLDASTSTSSQPASSSEDSQTTKDLKEFLRRNGRRSVPDREIPLAVAYSSTKVMCNPTSNALSFNSLFPSSSSKTSSDYSASTMLAEETQYQDSVVMSSISRREIPETQQTEAHLSHQDSVMTIRPTTSMNLPSTSSARKRPASNEAIEENHLSKKVATQKDTTQPKTLSGIVRNTEDKTARAPTFSDLFTTEDLDEIRKETDLAEKEAVERMRESERRDPITTSERMKGSEKQSVERSEGDERTNRHITNRIQEHIRESERSVEKRPTTFTEIAAMLGIPGTPLRTIEVTKGHELAGTDWSSKRGTEGSSKRGTEEAPRVEANRRPDWMTPGDEESVSGKRKNSSDERPADSGKRSKLLNPSQHFDDRSNDIFKRSAPSASANSKRSAASDDSSKSANDGLKRSMASDDSSKSSNDGLKRSAASDDSSKSVNDGLKRADGNSSSSAKSNGSDVAYNAVTSSDVRRRSNSPLNDSGWIDMCDLKSKVTLEDEDLSTTVLRLSLVNTSLCRTRVVNVVNETLPPGMKNVKVFSKQKLPVMHHEEIEFEISDDFADVACRLAFND